MGLRLKLAGVFVVLVLLVVGAWQARWLLVRLAPIDHTGTVQRIRTFHKGGFSSPNEKTRQLRQFALLFEDGFMCEGYDTSFATVEIGDQITIRGYHDVKGWPLLDPEWWECDEAQLMSLDATHE